MSLRIDNLSDAEKIRHLQINHSVLLCYVQNIEERVVRLEENPAQSASVEGDWYLVEKEEDKNYPAIFKTNDSGFFGGLYIKNILEYLREHGYTVTPVLVYRKEDKNENYQDNNDSR